MKVELIGYPTEYDWMEVKQYSKNSDEIMLGKKFGILTVIKREHDKYFPNGRHRDLWLCKCECGVKKIVLGPDLRYGKTTSCGCKKKQGSRRTHGGTHTRLFKIWSDMKSRCYNKNNKSYARYGGRGISVCREWVDSFENFRNWAVRNGYEESLTIDRIDNDGNYCPENCRWATVKSQMQNTSRNRRLWLNGEIHTLSEWSDITGIKSHTIARRIDVYKWDLEKALTEKVVK